MGDQLGNAQGVLQAMQDALHAVSQALLYPAIALLLLMVCYALFSLGSTIVEYVRERRHFNVVIPKFLREIQEATEQDVPDAIRDSGLLYEQRDVLLTIFENRDLDEEGLWALAKKLLLAEKQRRARVVSRNDAMSKLAPMVGLMGTLIPLGPGIVAFGRGDGTVMATAMLIAFDTTVTGLLVSAVMFVIARVRRRWYAGYQSSLEAAVTTLLERIGKMNAGASEPLRLADEKVYRQVTPSQQTWGQSTSQASPQAQTQPFQQPASASPAWDSSAQGGPHV